MPYYSELGLSSLPSSSAYSSLFLTGPYSNHSSIIASNLATPKSIPRQYRGVYKPHLSTITELNTPRRISSPKLLYQGTPSTIRPIKKINTADIDVSVNRYKRFDKYDRSKPEVIEKKTPDKSPSPARSPRQSVEEKDQKTAKPNTTIRRDRPTVRLQTVHKDTLQKEIGEIKSWRDNFKPEELGVEAKRRKKSPGEILKEKFLIRSRSKENILKPDTKKITRKNSVRKSPSFQEICEAITSDNLEEDLNPGQPEDVQRRQSRQISSEKILKQIRRNSTDLSEEDFKILDAILSEQNAMPSPDKVGKDPFESRTSVRKKRVKKSDDEDDNKIKKSHSKEKVAETEPKSPLQRRAVKKRSRTPSAEKEEKPDDLKVDIYQNVIRDISQVEIEQTAFKPKPVISGSGEIGQSKTALKAIVDDVEVQEAAKPKKEKKFRFNVIVEVEDEDNYDRRSITPEEIKMKTKPKVPKVPPGSKMTLTDNHKGTVQIPEPKGHIVSSILKKRSPVHKGKVIEEKVRKLVEESPIVDENKVDSASPASSIVNKVIDNNENTSDLNFFENQSLPSTPINKINNSDNSTPSSPLAGKKNIFSKENSKNEDSRPSSPGFFSSKNNSFDEWFAPSSPLVTKKNFFNNEDSKKEDSRPSSPGVFSSKNKNLHDSSVPSPPLVSQKNLFGREDSKKEDSRPSSPGVFSSKNTNLHDSSVLSSPLVSKKNLFNREDSKREDSRPSSPGMFSKNKSLDNSSVPSSPLASKKNLFSREDCKREDSRPSSPGIFSSKNKNLDNSSAPSSPLANKRNFFSRENSKKENSRPSSPGIFSNRNKNLDSSAPTSPFGSKSNLFNADNSRPSSPGIFTNKVKSLDNVTTPLSPIANKTNNFSKDNSKNDETSPSTPGTPKNKSLDTTSAPPSPFAGKLNIFNRNSSKKEDTPPSSPSVLLNKNVASVPSPVSPLAGKHNIFSSKHEDTPPSSPLFNKETFDTPLTAVLKKSDTESESNKDKVPHIASTSQDISLQEGKDNLVSPIAELVSKEVEAMIDNLKDIPKKPQLGDAEVKKDENDNTVLSEKEEPEVTKKLVSKRSLVQKANKDDPDLEVFVAPEPEPEPEPEPVEEKKDAFVPLQSNRLSNFMHPWKKPEQFDVCPVEIFARPKLIRGRHYPRPRGQPAPAPQDTSSEEEDDEEEEETEEDTSSEEETSEDECEENMATKVGASTSSNDSGFGSGAPGKNKDCDVNIHKKCEKLTANLCGVNQKLVVEAIESVRKGSLESRDSPTSNHANNPAFALDSDDIPEEYSQSSTYTGFQKSGRITPPATTIPRFRKYCLDDFNFLKVLGKGSFGKVLLAELKGTEYYYAIKCLKKDVVLEDDDVECTLIERKVLALGTKHPYLCHLLCTFQTESHLFFVMEYLNGGDLMFHIQASGRFPEHQARFYGAEIVSGLKFLHNKGIVYRDLKLDNVLLDFDGHVRIADFGMCKLQIFLDRMAETFCGTPDYMAPEIIKGLHYNQCVDWWSFGVLLYEMLLGQSPFSGCDEDELFWSICNEKPVLPRYLSTEATNILTLFLEKDASKRLGNRFSPHGDIQDQPFFRSIDWRALEARQLESPFKPNLQHPLDTQYFDKHFTVEKAKLTPIETTILQSMDQTQFQGFSYTNPNATDK